MKSFELDSVNVADGCCMIVIDKGFCRSVSEALLSYREGRQCRPNPACEALGHLVQQSGFVLAGADVRRFTQLIDKVVMETENVDE